MCSGSLIRTEKTKNRRVVLSAKHCFDNASDNVFAYAGRGKEISETDDLIPTPQTFLGRFKVTARFALADGSTDNRNLNLPNRIGYPFSDISVLILDHDLPEKVKPSEISRQAPDVEQDCVAVGYGNRGGKLGWQRPVTLDLKWVDDYNLVEISKNPQDPASLTGPGDSGGPLFCNVRGKKLQVGVVSGGSTLPNHRSDTYGAGFFARVDIVYDILEKILLKVDSGDALSPNDIPRQSDPMKP
jgi:hypothetical protein